MTDHAPVAPDPLEVELVLAGRSLVVEPGPDDLADKVVQAIRSRPVPRRQRRVLWWTWLRARRRRLVVAAIAVLLLLLTLTPPVRAAVGEWLHIGGILIRTGTAPVPFPDQPDSPAPPVDGREMTLDRARATVAFPIGVPTALGEPERITVTEDKRVVGMDWTIDGKPVHLDQFDGTLSWVFLKQNWSIVTPTDVVGAEAAWLDDPHEIVYVDRAGVERRETARISGPSLVWQPILDGRELTVRLEGFARLEDARTIAESLR